MEHGGSGTAEAPSGEYEQYLRDEWALFDRDPSRVESARAAAAGISLTRVLDVGCGAGQELRPFLRDHTTLGVGLDISPQVARVGRELFARAQPHSRVAFVRGAAEALPFDASCFDLIVCRLALPYTHNAMALSEIARVLRPGGVLLLKYHHVRYYTRELRDALVAMNVKAAIHAIRVMAAGCLYHVTGTQPRFWLTGSETFQSMWLLRRELGRRGLQIRQLLADSVPAAPNLVIVRQRGGDREALGERE